MLVHWTATHSFSFPLPKHHKQQLSPYVNSEVTRLFILLSGGEPFKTPYYNGQGKLVVGCLPSAMEDGIDKF